MLSDEDFNTYCKEFDGICFIAFLPHIYDTTAEERNKKLTILETIQSKHKSTPICFLWSEGGAQYDFEQTFGLSFGYPALMAMSTTKNKYSVMRSGFTEKNVGGFVIGLMTGKEPLKNIQKLPTGVKAVSAWDGKDRKPLMVDDWDDDWDEDENIEIESHESDL